MKEITNHDYKFWANAADNLIKGLPKLLSAIKTLESKRYTYQGGELWTPPVGKTPDFNLIDSLNEKIKELESEKHINEIKAQGIEEFIQLESEKLSAIGGNKIFKIYSMVIRRLKVYTERLRANHD